MPLHDAASLSLHVRAGALASRPKHAMIVRMSAETLDALDAFPSHPPLSFDFGDAPGICIGDAFFPMRPQKESSPHELYLRAASAARPTAPLKLYANVIGKFMVERKLGDKASDKVRQQTLVAKQQHLERQAILLDQPPVSAPPPRNAKRKLPGSGAVVKKPPPPDARLAPAPASTQPSPKPSPLPQPKANADVRRRLVHCLAISPRLSDDAVRMVGGPNTSNSAREDLLALLEDVAEQRVPTKKGDKSPRPWSLKPQTWTEVRPFGWPKLTEAERITMSRQARMVFKALKIPESDPAWDHVRYRPTATALPAPQPMVASNSAKSSTAIQPEPKRSAAVSTKNTKLKPKQDPPRAKGEIRMKDETAKMARTVKRAEADRPPSSSETGSATKTRRLPGSGYQAKNSPQPSATPVAEKSGTSHDVRPAPKPSLPASLPPKPTPAAPQAGGTHARKTVSTMQRKQLKKEDASDRELDREYERQRERERGKREREKERQREELEMVRERVETDKREKAKQKEREAPERAKPRREKERERDEMEQEKRQREKERVLKETTSGGATTFKRKTVMQDTEETPDDAPSKSSLPKRRKLDDGASVATSSSSRARDAELPKKQARDASPLLRPKMKKNEGDRRAATTAGAHRSSKAGGGAKPRRRSPIYTSSEDDSEILQARKRIPSPPPVSDRSISSDQTQTENTPRHHRPTRVTYPPATDHAALRALYQSLYAAYLGTFSEVVAQKRKLEAILNGDSDAEVDVMDPDDLTKLSMEHKSLKTELERIHDIFTSGSTAVPCVGSPSA